MAGALHLKRGVEARLPKDRNLQGVGKKGANVGVGFKMTSDTEALLTAKGPMQLIERDTKAHTIQPVSRGRGAKRKQRNGVLLLPDGQFRGAVKHPGTKGKHVFEKGVDDGRPKALKAMADPIGDAIKRGLRSG